MELLIAILAVVVIVGVPGYYIGKAAQRDQTFYDCQHHGKTELNARGARENWIECRPANKAP